MNPNTLTVLTSPTGIQCGCKVLDTDWNVLQPYANAKKFIRSEITAETLDELRVQLEVLMQRRDSFLVYGAPTDAWPEGATRLRRSRSKPGQPATLTADRETQWLILDVDKANSLTNTLKYAGLGGVAHIGISSSSDRGEGLESCRVFFRLDKPYPLCQVQAWAKSLPPECCVDPKIYEPQQPIYVAAPVFMQGEEEVGDLLEGRMWVAGGKLTVGLPELDLPAPAEPVDVGAMLSESAWPESFRGVVEKCEVLGDLVDGKIPVRCPWEGEHTSEGGETSTALLVPTTEYPEGSFKCLHAHCDGRGLPQLRELLQRETWKGLPADKLEALAQDAEKYRAERSKPGNGSTVAAAAGSEALVQPVGDWEEFLSHNLHEYVYLRGIHKVGSVTTRSITPYTGWALSVQNQPGRAVQPEEGSKAKPKTIKQDVLWKNSEHRQTCQHVVYDPGEAAAVIEPESLVDVPKFNLYRPPVWASAYEAGGGDGLRGLDSGLWDAFCEHGEYLWGEDWPVALDWFAGRVQTPGQRPKFALLHISENQGLGRGWLKNVLTLLLGLDNVFSLKLGRTTGQFNGYVQSVLAIVDEVYEEGTTSGEKRRIGSTLNDIITESYLGIERKGEEIVHQHVPTGFWFMSNHMDALSLVTGDRRMHCSATSRQPMPAEYYDALYGLIGEQQGGHGVRDQLVQERYLRLYGELKRHVIRTNLMGRAPWTEYKGEMELMSRTVLEEVLHACLDVLLEEGIDLIDPVLLRMLAMKVFSNHEGYLRPGSPAENTFRTEATRVCRQRCIGPVLGTKERIAVRLKVGPFKARTTVSGWVICPDATQGGDISGQRVRAERLNLISHCEKVEELRRKFAEFAEKERAVIEACMKVDTNL